MKKKQHEIIWQWQTEYQEYIYRGSNDGMENRCDNLQSNPGVRRRGSKTQRNEKRKLYKIKQEVTENQQRKSEHRKTQNRENSKQ